MPNLPWFKFFPSDYLLDPDVDAIPSEAEGLLIRMWCLCHLEGSCPADPESLRGRLAAPCSAFCSANGTANRSSSCTREGCTAGVWKRKGDDQIRRDRTQTNVTNKRVL